MHGHTSPLFSVAQTIKTMNIRGKAISHLGKQRFHGLKPHPIWGKCVLPRTVENWEKCTREKKEMSLCPWGSPQSLAGKSPIMTKSAVTIFLYFPMGKLKWEIWKVLFVNEKKNRQKYTTETLGFSFLLCWQINWIRFLFETQGRSSPPIPLFGSMCTFGDFLWLILGVFTQSFFTSKSENPVCNLKVEVYLLKVFLLGRTLHNSSSTIHPLKIRLWFFDFDVNDGW